MTPAELAALPNETIIVTGGGTYYVKMSDYPETPWRSVHKRGDVFESDAYVAEVADRVVYQPEPRR